MSKVTTVLNKLGLFAAMRAKVDFHLPRVSLSVLHTLPHLGRHAEWSSNNGYLEFQRAHIARRNVNEIEGRLPVAR